MEGSGTWQGLTLVSIVTWICLSSYLRLTQKVRSLVQPWVARQVVGGVPLILEIQKHQSGVLDALFSGLSCVVSVPFYTAFLPLLFWSGHGRLARQMTLLIAFCDYLGNCIKIDPTVDNGIILCYLYLLHYVLSSFEHEESSIQYYGFAFACLLVALIAFGRIYLGMHSVVDIIAGLAIGVLTLGLWLTVNENIDDFITSKQNVSSFWTALSFLLLFAYPTPENPTPSYEYHTAFTGVALGIVTGVQQTYSQFHHEGAPRIFSPELPVTAYIGRVMVGIPTILLVKFCSKSLAKWILPTVSNTLGIPIRSTTYIPKLKLDKGYANGKNTDETKNSVGYSQKMCEFLNQDSFDIDTGIRFLQYAGLAWSVVDLVPSMFSYLNL
ncbi:hypothetical protein HID58_071455 [Brassica napus]|uniref:Phosphatidic acid phosphatase type 2/haloperoxidase domain-containing protein n=1 Tax=Brassica napus TaxID=3708 RepID=A0ABQ7Z1R4_BRANA|nr:hypothetical protein HID58_071455 [Brassica napus]